MGLYLFLTVIQAIVAASLVGVVLMQRSEGGGLGVGGGGSPGGLMSARGAADFLTRTTKWLAVLFVVFSIALAAVAIKTTGSRDIDDSLDRTVSTGTAPAAEAVAPTQDTQGAAPDAAAPAEPAQDDGALADVGQ